MRQPKMLHFLRRAVSHQQQLPYVLMTTRLRTQAVASRCFSMHRAGGRPPEGAARLMAGALPNDAQSLI